MPEPALAPLDHVDPAQAWQPWQPDAEHPFDLKWAGHLYRRAAFGASLADLKAAVARGLPATLDQLLKGDPDKAAGFEYLLARDGEKIARENNAGSLRAWWLYAMHRTPHPLREKMTLFWHNHFATSIVKVQRAVLMYQQNVLLRRHALGKFRPFLEDISKDPAMLIWLDSNNNIKGKANENYARELMELFSLGVGNYTEQDIREAARAFTGWHTDGEKYDFNRRFHDDGAKTVFGKTGDWNGDDVVHLCLEKPASALFIVRKMYRYFVSETAKPPDALLAPLAEVFRKSDHDIAALVRAVLGSRHFFSAHAYRQRVKCPAEYMVGAIKALIAPQSAVPPRVLGGRLEAMGQLLFAPPSVKGWDWGQPWLNTATILARHNFAQQVASGNLGSGNPRPSQFPAVKVEAKPTKPGEEPPPPEATDPAALIKREKMTDPGQIVGLLADVLLQGDVAKPARDKLVAFVAEGNPKDKALDQRVRETVHALMTMPEYQLA
jgi:hypothetical protein